MAVETNDRSGDSLSTMSHLPSVDYPKPGEGPKRLEYAEILDKFPFAGLIKDELKVIIIEMRRLSNDHHDAGSLTPEDSHEFARLAARERGIINTINLLGLGAINLQADEELPKIEYGKKK